MSSPLQRIAKFSIITLLGSALYACGGAETSETAAKTATKSDMADAATAVVADAVADEGPGTVKEDMAAAKAAMQDAVASAGAVAASAGEVAANAGNGAAAAAPDLAAGEATYGRFCFSCHAAGVAGAPKLGSAEDWAPRIAKGLDMLVATSIEGIPPGMPAKGLCMSCTEEDMRNTVAWMIAQ